MNVAMNAVYLILGVVLLLAGRRLYWLFVGVVGFGLGIVLAQEFFRPEGFAGATDGREWGLLIGVVGGLVGAVLAVLFQKLAVALAGAVAGGFGGWVLFEAFGAGSLAWLGMAIGAVLGAILVVRLFDWGLIFFSSVAGAKMLVVDGMRMDPSEGVWIFLVAFAMGVLVQGLQLVRARTREKEVTRRPERESERAG